MDQDRWRRVEDLYRSALERTPEARAAFLEQACPDSGLRREVESLLLHRDDPAPAPAWPLSETFPDGARLGPYEILGRIGAGGMGTVYRSRDSRVDRIVAVKICREHLAGRFEREGRAIAALNHPHVCTLYDLGQQDGVDYLVMEYVEGESLAERLAKGRLPSALALRFAIEIADALAAAHARGIVHADLKPGNIMLTRSGVKVLDFGLARMERSAASPLTQTVTQAGAIFGTPHYMSPEQIEGKEMDARSDIFSFGLVLFEMLTGRRAFEGESAARVTAGILEREPPPLGSSVPHALQRLLLRCLAKDPEERWHSAHDLKTELQWIAGAEPLAGPSRRFGAGWIVAAIFAATLAAVLLVQLRKRSPEQLVVRLPVLPPGNERFTVNDTPVLSPDGTRLVFSAGGKLFLRSLDSLAAQELPGTGGGHFPFWSPDGRSVAFFASHKLEVSSLTGGPPVALCDVTTAQGGAWNRDGVILFSPNPPSPLMHIATAGETPRPVTKLDPAKGEIDHAWPAFLPDGRHFLFTIYASQPAAGGIFIGSLDSPGIVRLLPDQTNAQYTAPGYILFTRAGSLMAQPFDDRKLRFNGDLFPVAEMAENGSESAAAFSASAGVLAYRSGPPEGLEHLRWFDRKGTQLADLGFAGVYTEPGELSPDGHTVVAAMETASQWTLWTFDLVRGVDTRLTFGRGNYGYPRWSPDGRQIAFSFDGESPMSIRRRPVGGAGAEELVARLDRNAALRQWTADGSFLILTAFGAGKPQEIWAAPLTGGAKPFPVVAGPFNNDQGRVSPDGKWIAYVAEETGRPEVYVQDFPRKVVKSQISHAGGAWPRWRGDGRELFYREGTKVMSVDVNANGGKLQPGIPQPLFEAPIAISQESHFDVSADGQRLLLVVPDDRSGPPRPFIVMINWPAGVKR